MRNKSILFIFLILAGCTTQRYSTAPHITLTPLNDTVKKDDYQAEVHFAGFENQNYTFNVSISNHSKDSILVDPSLFSYQVVSKTKPHIIYSINPEQRKHKLNREKDSLMRQTNPYSLAGKSTKEIVRRGLINGTIAALFGQKSKDWEKQREENKYDWDQNHGAQLNSVEKELNFWQNQTLMSRVVAPDSNISGKVLFPVTMGKKTLQINVLIQKDTLNFRFSQLN